MTPFCFVKGPFGSLYHTFIPIIKRMLAFIFQTWLAGYPKTISFIFFKTQGLFLSSHRRQLAPNNCTLKNEIFFSLFYLFPPIYHISESYQLFKITLSPNRPGYYANSQFGNLGVCQANGVGHPILLLMLFLYCFENFCTPRMKHITTET